MSSTSCCFTNGTELAGVQVCSAVGSPSPPPPPPFSQTPCDPETNPLCTTISGSQVVTSIVVSSIFGFLVMLAWVIVRKPLRHIYLKRATQIADLVWRPPPLKLAGAAVLWSYLNPVLTCTDADLLRTAGMDALMLSRFIALGVQIMLPTAALSCAVLLPIYTTQGYLTDTGTTSSANTANGIAYTGSMSNVYPNSLDLLVPFFFSFVFAAYSCWVLRTHYMSYCMLRLAHFHAANDDEHDDAPAMRLVGSWGKSNEVGREHVRQLLLSVLWAPAMHQQDVKFVMRMFEAKARREALHQKAVEQQAQQQQQAQQAQPDAAAQPHPKLSQALLSKVPTFRQRVQRLGTARAGEIPAAVAPWWLPPEQQPEEVSAVHSTTSVLLGKACVARRDRVQAKTSSGRKVWAAADLYCVLFREAGPGPTKEVIGVMRRDELESAAEPPPPELLTDGPAAESASTRAKPSKSSKMNGGGSSSKGSYGRKAWQLLRQYLGLDPSATSPEVFQDISSHLGALLRERFGASFQQLVPVHDHRRVDHLIGEWDHKVITKLEQSRAALAACRQQLAERSSSSKEGAGGGSKGSKGRKKAKSKADLAEQEETLEAEVAELEKQAAALEEQILAARAEALAKPLPTAFIAIFRSQADALVASASCHGQYGAVHPYYYTAERAPAPSDVNWPTLWCSWREAWWRGLATIVPLALVMVFPIGLLTGALTNLDVAVCANPATNNLYWPWFCQSTGFWVKLCKEILTGILPSIISTFWDTYALPILYYLLAQMERRHPSLSSLDQRITTLFYIFSIVNFFFQSVIGGAVFQQAGQFGNSLGSWIDMLGISLPSAANYFINYLLIHALFTNLFRFVWPHDGTVLFVFFRAMGLFRPKCSRDEYIIRTTPSYRGGRHYGAFFNAFVVAFAYSVVSPITLPAALAFFVTSWIAWRYSILHFYERCYEGAGHSWENLYTLVLAAQYVGCVFAALVMMAKGQLTLAVLMIVLHAVLHYASYSSVQNHAALYVKQPPLRTAMNSPSVEIDPAVYMPPPLRHGAVGWFPEWGKVWEKYGISRYTW